MEKFRVIAIFSFLIPVLYVGTKRGVNKFLIQPDILPSQGNGGVSFQRTVGIRSQNFGGSIDFSGSGKSHCHGADDYGDNFCHYDWNEHIHADYSIALNETITSDAYFTGTFLVRA